MQQEEPKVSGQPQILAVLVHRLTDDPAARRLTGYTPPMSYSLGAMVGGLAVVFLLSRLAALAMPKRWGKRAQRLLGTAVATVAASGLSIVGSDGLRLVPIYVGCGLAVAAVDWLRGNPKATCRACRSVCESDAAQCPACGVTLR